MGPRQVEAWRQNSAAAIDNVRRLLEQYRMLYENLQEGMIFYTSLQDAIHKVSGQCSDYALSRDLQRKDMRVRA
eukprot:1932223-Pyramimonas_sp.AAC.4